jgi:hypothetical protein
MTTIRGTMTGAAVLGAAGLAAMAIAISWPSSTDVLDSGSSLEAVPTWFKPIEQSYGKDSAVTPSFDFASLYAAPQADYFAPISSYYHGQVGPQFDFASLYASPQPASFAPIARYYRGRVGSGFDFASLYGAPR